MGFELETTTKTAPVWRSDRSKSKISVDTLIDQVAYLIYVVRLNGPQGPKWRDDSPMGYPKIPFLIERGIMRPLIVSIDDDGYDIPSWEVVDVAALEAAAQELKTIKDTYPIGKAKSARPI
jgi:hypothetical protein